MKRKIFTGILVIVTACLVLGCGKKEEGTQKAEEPETENNDGKEVEKEEEYRIIGEESGDSVRCLLTNQTGKEIIGLSVKASSDKEASGNLLDKGMKIGKEETVCMYYTPEKPDSEEGEKVPATYDLILSYEDGQEVEVTGLELEDLEAAELCFEDEVGFAKYKSADSGKEISTKETALALKAQKQAKAAAEEKKKAEAEQKAEAERAAAEKAKKDAEAAAAAQAQAAAQVQYEQQYYEQPVYQEPVYEEPVYQEPVYEEPVYEQPADSGGQNQDVGQSGESCLGGQGVLRY